MNLENLNSNFSLVLSHISADDVERDRLFEEEDYISMDEHHMYMQPFEHVSEGRYKILADYFDKLMIELARSIYV